MDGRRRFLFPKPSRMDGCEMKTTRIKLVNRILPATKIDSFASYSVPGWYIQGNV